jgi:hypothetical protein
VKARNAKRKGHRFPHNVDEAYRDYIRGLPCCVSGLYPVDPAHVKSRGSGGADLGNMVPLVHHLHRELDHQIGRREFEAKYGVDLAAIARNLGERYTPTEAAW